MNALSQVSILVAVLDRILYWTVLQTRQMPLRKAGARLALRCRRRDPSNRNNIILAVPPQPQPRQPRAKDITFLDRADSCQSTRRLKLADIRAIAAAQILKHPGCSVPKNSSVAP